VAQTDYLPRLIDPLIARLLGGLPAVLIAGPRAAGKTTSARRHAATTVRLDREREAAAIAADPDSVLASLIEPILLDEWQMTPAVLGAVKRAVDDDSRPGRFLLTGSARADSLADGWPATGRVVRVTQWGLTRREIEGDPSADSFFDELFTGGLANLVPPPDPPDLAGYVERALLGGFPEVVLQSKDELRRRWLAGYIDQLLTRDAPLVGEHRDPRRLRRYLQSLAANTAGVVEHKTVYDAAGISRMSALAYDGLLDLLMVTEQVPAWSTNRLKRLARTAKRFVVDPSLLIPLQGVDRQGVLRDGDLLGRLLETFVLAQLRPELEVSHVAPTLFHLRDERGRREIDLIAEAPDGRLVAIEVKATSAPGQSDARHLLWLRDAVPDHFVAGIVLHTGPRPFALAERIYAIPIAAIWGPRGEPS
jgi:uncharacterized protein